MHRFGSRTQVVALGRMTGSTSRRRPAWEHPEAGGPSRRARERRRRDQLFSKQFGPKRELVAQRSPGRRASSARGSASSTERMRLHLLLVAFSACASTALTLLGGPQLACAEASTASRRPRPLLLSAAPPPPPSHGSSKISVSNEMLAIGLPALAGLAVDPVASLVDTGFVGRMCGSGPLAGAAVASEWGRHSNLEPGSHPSTDPICKSTGPVSVSRSSRIRIALCQLPCSTSCRSRSTSSRPRRPRSWPPRQTRGSGSSAACSRLRWPSSPRPRSPSRCVAAR